jgi:hypothetical protein
VGVHSEVIYTLNYASRHEDICEVETQFHTFLALAIGGEVSALRSHGETSRHPGVGPRVTDVLEEKTRISVPAGDRMSKVSLR